MTKFIAFSDIHIHNYSQFSVNDDRANACICILKEIFEYGETNNVDFYTFLGDWYEKKSYLNPTLFNQTNKVISGIATKPIYSVIGHHDSFINDNDSYTMASNKLIKLLTKEPLNINNIKIRGYHYWLEHNDIIDLSNCDMVLFHFNSLLDIDRANSKVLELYGHLHDPGSLSNNIHIVGSPMYHDFGDNSNIPRGFLEVNFSEGSFEIKRILLNSKKFITVTNSNEVKPEDGNYYRLLTHNTHTYKKFLNRPNVIVKYIGTESHTSINRIPYLLNPLNIIKETNPDSVGVSIYNKFKRQNEIRN